MNVLYGRSFNSKKAIVRLHEVAWKRPSWIICLFYFVCIVYCAVICLSVTDLITTVMSLKLNPPDIQHKSYEQYKQELKAWNQVTDIEDTKCGIAVALSLPENVEYGIRENVFDQLEVSTLSKKDGLDHLIQFLDTHLGKDELADSLEKFEDFEDYQRQNGQFINDFISKFDQKYNKISKKEMKLPLAILAFKLLKRSNITREEKMLELNGMDMDKKDTLYEQAKLSLKR